MTGEAVAADHRGTAVHHIVVGLVADPGLPEKVSHRVADEVRDQLSRQVSGSVSWDLRVCTEALPLDEEGRLPVLEIADSMLPSHGWDMVVCLTELPRRVDGRPATFDVSTSHSVALVSLPALGWFRMRAHARDTLVLVIGRMAAERLGAAVPEPHPDARWLRALQRTAPRRELRGDGDGVDSYLALTGLRGWLRLVSGMVRTNRPWRLVSSLSNAIAAAIGTAAFGIFYSSIWTMADVLSPWRLGGITLLAITAMVGWLIWHNGLWQRPRGAVRPRGDAMLYNVSTTLTLFVGVACMYVLLFSVILVGALAMISADYLESTLQHPVGFYDYVSLVWMSSSMGTVGGALGSSLESEAAVRQATYSKRERERLLREDQDEEPS